MPVCESGIDCCHTDQTTPDHGALLLRPLPSPNKAFTIEQLLKPSRLVMETSHMLALPRDLVPMPLRIPWISTGLTPGRDETALKPAW
jgi:hypothetical protein